MASQWDGHIRSRDKLNTLYIHLQKTHEHQTKEGDDWQWDAPILKATWPFDHMTFENFKNLYFHYHQSYSQYTRQDANLHAND